MDSALPVRCTQAGSFTFVYSMGRFTVSSAKEIAANLGRPTPLSGMTKQRISDTFNKAFVFLSCNMVIDSVSNNGTIQRMIKSFQHKGLAELFEQGRTRRINRVYNYVV